jgi:hypothetical protein
MPHSSQHFIALFDSPTVITKDVTCCFFSIRKFLFLRDKTREKKEHIDGKEKKRFFVLIILG